MTVQRTTEEIVLALNSSRERIGTQLRARSVESSTGSLASSSPLWRTLNLVQQYLQVCAQTYITPSSVIHFATRRPILVGVAVTAIVLTGPARLIGWASKAATMWRLLSAVKSR